MQIYISIPLRSSSLNSLTNTTAHQNTSYIYLVYSALSLLNSNIGMQLSSFPDLSTVSQSYTIALTNHKSMSVSADEEYPELDDNNQDAVQVAIDYERV